MQVHMRVHMQMHVSVCVRVHVHAHRVFVRVCMFRCVSVRARARVHVRARARARVDHQPEVGLDPLDAVALGVVEGGLLLRAAERGDHLGLDQPEPQLDRPLGRLRRAEGEGLPLGRDHPEHL